MILISDRMMMIVVLFFMLVSISVFGISDPTYDTLIPLYPFGFFFVPFVTSCNGSEVLSRWHERPNEIPKLTCV